MDTADITNKLDRPRPPALNSSGFLLSKFSLFFLLGVFIYAALIEEFTILILIGIILATAGLAKLWSRIALLGIECHQALSKHRIFPGEYTELSLKLTNRKPLPLPWIQVEKELASVLEPDDALLPGNRPGYGCLRHITALLWYRSILWRHRICGTKRGYYQLNPTQITSGDIFGLYSRSVTIHTPEALIVFPKIFPIEHFTLPSFAPAGEIRAENQLFHDAIKPIGVREYCPGDSLRQVHWKASARQQKLQVKIFEPTIARKTALMLAVDTFHESGSRNEEKFELAVSTVASIAYHSLEQGSPVGLFINTQLADTCQAVSLAPSSNQNQIGDILETLAKTTSTPSSSFEAFLKNERDRIPYGTALVIMVDRLSSALYALLANLYATRSEMLILHTGNPDPVANQIRIPMYSIDPTGHFQNIQSRAYR